MEEQKGRVIKRKKRPEMGGRPDSIYITDTKHRGTKRQTDSTV